MISTGLGHRVLDPGTFPQVVFDGGFRTSGTESSRVQSFQGCFGEFRAGLVVKMRV